MTEKMMFYEPEEIEPEPPPGAKSMGKVIQIQTGNHGGSFAVFALKEDGSIWLKLHQDSKGWEKWTKFTWP
jgi:hypothetical protein